MATVATSSALVAELFGAQSTQLLALFFVNTEMLMLLMRFLKHLLPVMEHGDTRQDSGFQPSEGQAADWFCSSGLYSDPEEAYSLPSGSKIVVGDITCFASETVARCDNNQDQYLVLGSEIFGFGN